MQEMLIASLQLMALLVKTQAVNRFVLGQRSLTAVAEVLEAMVARLMLSLYVWLPEVLLAT